MALALYAPGLGYYASAVAQVRPAAGLRQRLRHRARDVARCSAGRWRCRWRRRCDATRHRRGLGVRRRLRRAGGCSCWTALGERGAPLHDRRPVGRAARAPARTAGRLGRPGALGRRAARRAAAASWSATRCWTRCRCSCCLRRATPGTSAAWRCDGRRLRLGRPRRPACARRSSRGARHGYRHRDPPAGAGLHPHAGRHGCSGRGLLHRLRLPRGRVLPPAAPHAAR